MYFNVGGGENPAEDFEIAVLLQVTVPFGNFRVAWKF